MKVKLEKAVKMFFGNSSLEMVYFEALANALDAEASKVRIEIEATVKIQKSPEIKLPIGVFIWDIDAVVEDAQARNSTFLNLIKSKLK